MASAASVLSRPLSLIHGNRFARSSSSPFVEATEGGTFWLLAPTLRMTTTPFHHALRPHGTDRATKCNSYRLLGDLFASDKVPCSKKKGGLPAAEAHSLALTRTVAVAEIFPLIPFPSRDRHMHAAGGRRVSVDLFCAAPARKCSKSSKCTPSN